MIANYFLLAIRNLLKQRGYALVNIFGLAVGLAAAICILLYVKDELTFDRMHPNAENLYRIGIWLQAANGDVFTGGYAPAGWDNYIQSNYEGIDAIGSYIRRGMPTTIHYIPKDKIVINGREIILCGPNLPSPNIVDSYCKRDQNNPLGGNQQHDIHRKFGAQCFR